MAQQPFATTGVQAKLSELYDLNDTLLGNEADALETDFRSWMKTNFSFDTAQSAYLDNMDDQWIDTAANRTALAIRNRLDITLDTPNGYPQGIQYASKIVRSEDNIICDNGPTGWKVSGDIRFIIAGY